MSKATNVTKQSRKAGEAHPTTVQMVAYCVAAFADATSANATLENAKALWDAARMGLRTELSRAKRIITAPKDWTSFLASVRAGLVKAKVCATPKEAGRLVDNQLIALGLTGKGTRKGGKRKGAGRPERTSAGEAVHGDAARLCVAALAYAAKGQETFAGDTDVLEWIGGLCAILGGAK